MEEITSYRVLQFFSNKTMCIEFDMATWIASNKSMVSASRTLTDESK